MGKVVVRPPYFLRVKMFLEIRVLSIIEKAKEMKKDIQSFEDPAKKSTQAGVRAKMLSIEIEKDLKALRKEIMSIRKTRVATGEKKTL